MWWFYCLGCGVISSAVLGAGAQWVFARHIATLRGNILLRIRIISCQNGNGNGVTLSIGLFSNFVPRVAAFDVKALSGRIRYRQDGIPLQQCQWRRMSVHAEADAFTLCVKAVQIQQENDALPLVSCSIRCVCSCSSISTANNTVRWHRCHRRRIG
jgi:hypothetical protein